MNNIIDILKKDTDFSILLQYIKAAGLEAKLSGEGEMTLFAPTNDAFEELEEDGCELKELLEDKEELKRIVLYHVLPKKLTTREMFKNRIEFATTAEGDEVDIDVDEDATYVNDAEIIQPDMHVSNGIIHVIDAVLIPE